MSKVSDTYTWDEMCELSDGDMENLLKFYASGKVPTLAELKGPRHCPETGLPRPFDGSFGFSVGG